MANTNHNSFIHCQDDDYFAANSLSNLTTSTYCAVSGPANRRSNVSPFYGGKSITGNPSNLLKCDEASRNSSFRSNISMLRAQVQSRRDPVTPDDVRLENTMTDSQYSSRKNSTSTITQDFEIIELLERERSMDIQEMIGVEKRSVASSRYPTVDPRRESFESSYSVKLPKAPNSSAYLTGSTNKWDNLDTFSDNYVPDRIAEQSYYPNSHRMAGDAIEVVKPLSRYDNFIDRNQPVEFRAKFSKRSSNQFSSHDNDLKSSMKKGNKSHLYSSGAHDFPLNGFMTDL